MYIAFSLFTSSGRLLLCRRSKLFCLSSCRLSVNPSLIPPIKQGIDHRSMDGGNHRLEFGLQAKVKVLISSQKYGTFGTVPCTLIITESFRQEEMS
jgi:hypothetical protein